MYALPLPHDVRWFDPESRVAHHMPPTSDDRCLIKDSRILLFALFLAFLAPAALDTPGIPASTSTTHTEPSALAGGDDHLGQPLTTPRVELSYHVSRDSLGDRVHLHSK